MTQLPTKSQLYDNKSNYFFILEESSCSHISDNHEVINDIHESKYPINDVWVTDNEILNESNSDNDNDDNSDSTLPSILREFFVQHKVPLNTASALLKILQPFV